MQDSRIDCHSVYYQPQLVQQQEVPHLHVGLHRHLLPLLVDDSGDWNHGAGEVVVTGAGAGAGAGAAV